MHRFWVSVLGTGYSPFAPGTCGSAVGSLIFLILALTGAGPLAISLTMVAIVSYGSVITVTFGKRAIISHGDDPSIIVSDELAGQALTYLGIWYVAGTFNQTLIVTATGFVLFRIFDIVKPWPASYFDRMKNAWGVLLDDLAAGIYAAILLHLIYRFAIC